MRKSIDIHSSKEQLLDEIAALRSSLTEKNKELALLHQQQSSEDVKIDSAMFPIVVIDRESGEILHINQFAADYFAISVEDAKKKNAVEFWCNPSRMKEFVELLKENGRVFQFEADLLTVHKSIKHVLLSSRKNTYQGRRAYYAAFSDITDRKNAELAHQQSEARYQEMYRMMRHMADTVPDMLWAKDLDDKYIFANQAIRQKLLMCREGESPIGNHDMFFAKRERSEGHKHTFGEICIDSDEIVKRKRKACRFLEDGLVRGSYLALDVHKAPLFEKNGELIGTVGAGRDVTQDLATKTALEESDKRFRLFAENIQDVLWVTDPEFKPTYVTPSIEALSGYSQEEFLSMPISLHMTPTYRKKFKGLSRLMASLSNKKHEIPARFYEFECKKKDGSIIWVEIVTSALLAGDGSLKGFAGVIRDTTKRVQGQKELELAKEIALTASQTKSEFLANMSHEIRTPMNGVLGILQLLRDTPLNRKQEKYVETALSSGTSLLNLISDILDFSKIEAGKIELVTKPLSLSRLIGTVVDSFESLVDRKNVSINYLIDKSVPSTVLADETRLKQIFFNLVGNAVKFTSQGRIDIRLKAESLSSTAEQISLSCTIRDTGEGVSEQLAGRLFEPFVQEDGSFRRRYGGTGLGLSIVKKLVEMMGGDIRLESAVDQGTVVSFSVMVHQMEDSNPVSMDESASLPFEIAPSRVLVVEDEEINALVISAMLKKLGQDVHLASNGRQALQKVAELEFDCIFMDIQMPELDGVETTRAIRLRKEELKEKVPIIALTAHAMKGDRERFMAAGMDDYLAKPVEMKDLVEVLQRLQRNRKLS